MSLEHALLVSLRERPGTGIELARRFDRTVGFFWQATHQQIYRVLRRMEADGWLATSAGEGRSTERRYAPTDAGLAELARWIAEPTEPAALRSEVAVKMRGAAYGDRAALLEQLRGLRLEHQARLAHYEQLEREQFPDPTALSEHARDVWLVLRGGLRQEQYWVDWLTDYLDAWASTGSTTEGAPS
ncbi:PadR family transcriptional regulator [Nocardioides marmoraquaticus]